MMTLAIIRRALRRPLQWRLLVVSPIVLAAAASATLFSLAGFLGGVFDHSTRWREISSSLDSSGLAALAKALMTPAAAQLGSAVRTSVWLAVLFAPLLAGAALVVAEADARPAVPEPPVGRRRVLRAAAPAAGRRAGPARDRGARRGRGAGVGVPRLGPRDVRGRRPTPADGSRG